LGHPVGISSNNYEAPFHSRPYAYNVFTNADGSRVDRVFFYPRLSVCLFFRTISQNRSWKPIYFGVKRSKVKIT